ncbi:hypothetical protein MNBD_GAMMA25-1482 [hydrothermal vent metagenome]|uniref:DUF4340 domain-containing protein n=1 Tax=hydrothermal vent metagenome TaxID=652676 RepID=A0A3B1AYD1_9ZZZZ
MTSRTRLNLALLLIVLSLMTIVVLEPGKTPEPEAVLLTNLNSSDINKIKITRRDIDTIVLEKKSDHWKMLSPYTLAANDYKVEAVMKLLKIESAAQYDINQLDPVNYGLINPAVSILFNDSPQIDFGNLEPLHKQRYVRIDQQLHIIPDYYYYQLVSSVTDYLDHALIHEGEKITRIELPELTLALIDKKWTLSPENKNYSADAFTDLLNEWQYAHAVELRPLTKPRKNTGKSIRIFLQGRDIPIEYSLYQMEDEFILSRVDKNIEYVMAADKTDALLSLQKRSVDIEADSELAE